MNEPDRPHRDVSIEEAQRMPMSEEQAIVPSWEDVANRWERAYNEVCGERDALVAEVRRLRAENRHLMFNQRWMYKSLGLGLPPGMKR